MGLILRNAEAGGTGQPTHMTQLLERRAGLGPGAFISGSHSQVGKTAFEMHAADRQGACHYSERPSSGWGSARSAGRLAGMRRRASSLPM
jgi:hypothetical protein